MAKTLTELAEEFKNDIDWVIRRNAIVEISRFPEKEEVFSLLVEALDDPDVDVRETAIYALADLKNPDALEFLLKPKVLFEEEGKIRIAVVRALGNFRKVGGISVIGELLRLCNDAEWLVRNTAISVVASEIESIKSEEDPQSAILQLLSILQLPDKYVHNKVVKTLIEVGKEDTATLIKSLASRSIHVRSGVSHVLGELKCREAVEPLITLIDDENKTVRIEVTEALGKIGGEEVVIPLLKLISDMDLEVRTKAIKSISLQGESVVESLVAELRHTNNKFKKKAIIKALGLIKSEKSILPLIDCLQDSYNAVRKAAVNSLVAIGSKHCIKHLTEVLCKNPVDIKELLDMASNNKSIRLQVRAIRALGDLKEAMAMEQLSKQFYNLHFSNDAEKREKTAHDNILLKELIEALDKIKYAVWARRSALEALGKIKDMDALPAIIRSLSDTDVDVRYQALGAIENLKASEALKEVLALKDHPASFIRNKVVSVLGNIGTGNSEAVNAVLERLNDEERYVRSAAATALGKLGDKRAIEPLTELIHRQDFWSVRRDACFALNNLGVCVYSVEKLTFKEGMNVCPYRNDQENCPEKHKYEFCIYRDK